MHELSVCGALIDQVTALAAARGDAVRVRRITIEVGPLSGVDTDQLQAAFFVLRAGSCAASADLCIDTMALRIRCTTCLAVSATAPNRLVCTQCGSLRTQIVQGDELHLRRVELCLEDLPLPRERAVRAEATAAALPDCPRDLLAHRIRPH